MRDGADIQSIAACLYKAVLTDLPDIPYRGMTTAACEAKRSGSADWERHTEPRSRRPHESEVELYCWPQTWSDTSCGFGGMAGQAFTTAMTVVVLCPHTGTYAVYHAGQLAYRLKTPTPAFFEDMGQRRLLGARDGWGKRYRPEFKPKRTYDVGEIVTIEGHSYFVHKIGRRPPPDGIELIVYKLRGDKREGRLQTYFAFPDNPERNCFHT